MLKFFLALWFIKGIILSINSVETTFFISTIFGAFLSTKPDTLVEAIQHFGASFFTRLSITWLIAKLGTLWVFTFELAWLVALDTRFSTLAWAVWVRAFDFASFYTRWTVLVAFIKTIMSTNDSLPAFLLTVTMEKFSKTIATIVRTLMPAL